MRGFIAPLYVKTKQNNKPQFRNYFNIHRNWHGKKKKNVFYTMDYSIVLLVNKLDLYESIWRNPETIILIVFLLWFEKENLICKQNVILCMAPLDVLN